MGARGRAYRDRDSTAAVTMKKRPYANTGDKGAKRYWRIGPTLAKLEHDRICFEIIADNLSSGLLLMAHPNLRTNEASE